MFCFLLRFVVSSFVVFSVAKYKIDFITLLCDPVTLILRVSLITYQTFFHHATKKFKLSLHEQIICKYLTKHLVFRPTKQSFKLKSSQFTPSIIAFLFKKSIHNINLTLSY